MSENESSGCASSVGGGAVLFIVVGLFMLGSLFNRIRITNAIQDEGATTMGRVVDVYDRFYAVPFIEYTYTVESSTFTKEASLLGVGSYEAIRPGDSIQVSYVRSRPRTALPSVRVGVDDRDRTASAVCGIVPIGLGLLMFLGLELMRPRGEEERVVES